MMDTSNNIEKSIFAEINRLRTENEKLREENDAWQMDGASCSNEVKLLRAENEKLRAELRDADEMLLKQARTIRDYQDEAAALKETGDE